MATRWLRILAIVLLVLLAGDFSSLTLPPMQAAAASDVELSDGWKLSSAADARVDGSVISAAGYDDAAWVAVRRMPGTVLQILQEAGVYPDLYYGKNLLTEVPQNLYRQDWWYRSTFTAPAGFASYQLDFPGINYRAEIWLNGHRVADSSQIVGMYTRHEVDVTPWITPAAPNILAVRVTPERSIQDVDGVELADSWYDWINWRYLGYQGPGRNAGSGTSFVPDRNAGIFKPVRLKAFGSVALASATVNTALSDSGTARLSVYARVHNVTDRTQQGVLRATISRSGKRDIHVGRPVTLAPGEDREISFEPDEFGQLAVEHPELWWPYTLGEPKLYDLKLQFVQNRSVTNESASRFGIRTVTQSRDTGPGTPDGDDFYLKVNGRDFLVRGATYTPDLLYRYDPERDAAILRYTKDLGINMLRLESKIPSEGFAQLADEMGIPLMYGWMCCNQWEKWPQWDAEDHRVARESLRSQIAMLRSHPSVFIWANGSDGRPPDDVREDYRQILTELHWQNAVVDSVSAFARDRDGKPLWDGIAMSGPYSWRPPSYWFADRYGATRGASAEQGDNEHIPPFASLRRFIPPDRLWPINDTWYFHAGSNQQNSTLTNVRRVVDRRYGLSTGAQMFADKAQLAHYEATRAQFESFAAGGWADHKMTIYWMLNSHWPSFFGNIFDYYLRPGGAYYGAKKGLQPLSVVFDTYATGDHRKANVSEVNKSPDARDGLRVRVRIYDLRGTLRDDRWADSISVASGGATTALTLAPGPVDSPVFFVRCELLDDGGRIADNVYWQSRRIDDVGPPTNDTPFDSRQVSWADMTALNSMARVTPEVSASRAETDDHAVTITVHNPSARIAFFQRAEMIDGGGPPETAEEILPITYDDNYVTVFPGETIQIHGRVPPNGPVPRWVRVTGYNGTPVVTEVR